MILGRFAAAPIDRRVGPGPLWVTRQTANSEVTTLLGMVVPRLLRRLPDTFSGHRFCHATADFEIAAATALW